MGLVIRSEMFFYFQPGVSNSKEKKISLTRELVTQSVIFYFSTSN